MTGISPAKTISAGALISADMALMVVTLDALAGRGYEDFSAVETYAPLVARDRGLSNPWWHKPYEGQLAVSLCLRPMEGLRCILSREGQVNLYGPGGKPDHTFQIPEAGVFGDAAVGLGYVNRIRAVGNRLYVCGQSRQVYRFDWNGRDLAKGRWVDMAGPMRQPPMSEPPDAADEEAFDAWLDSNDAIDLVDINGPAEDDLYVVGDETWHWNGQQWRQLELPTDEPLAAIKVLNPREIILVGHNGTLLWGNALDGFQDLSSVDDNQNFTSVEWFEGRLYLASNLGLFTYDATSRRIEPQLVTGLQPELQDAHQLEAKDGVLWSFGFKDLAYFDGQNWTRVDHPDNPPIR